MHFMTDAEYTNLKAYKNFTYKKSEGLTPEDHTEEQLYHLGANHAFSDVMDMMTDDEGYIILNKKAVYFTGAVLVVAAIYKPGKRLQKKIKTMVRRKRPQTVHSMG